MKSIEVLKSEEFENFYNELLDPNIYNISDIESKINVLLGISIIGLSKEETLKRIKAKWDDLTEDSQKLTISCAMSGFRYYAHFVLLMENFDKVEELYFKKEIKEMENKKVLDIELFRYGSLVFGKVIYQDDNILKREEFEYRGKDFIIKAMDYPFLANNVLYIKGEELIKDDIAFYSMSQSENEAIQLTQKIKSIVNELNTKFLKKEPDKTDILSKIEKIM